MKIKLIILFIIMLTNITCNNKYKSEGKGTYGYDFDFLIDNNIEFIELSDKDGSAKIIVVPKWQGRIMTSTANGDQGNSYGWINYSFIEKGKVNKQFNVYGGEERFWLGPEGGPFSIYFKNHAEQIFKNWKVPSFIDTDAFKVTDSKEKSVAMQGNAVLINTSGYSFSIEVKRNITLLNKSEIQKSLGINNLEKIQAVAYKTENTLINKGKDNWSKETGLLSIWMLSMLTCSPYTTVFIPYENISQHDSIPVVRDEYFGKVPENRLIVDDHVIYFKADGKYRCKIGIPGIYAKDICGSYDAEKKILTLLWYNKPDTNKSYVNSNWGDQDNPYDGDAVNSYNDGPLEDGSVLGPFYEIETSSPVVELDSGDSIVHIQKVFHLEGDEKELNKVTMEMFGINIHTIKSKFELNE